MQAVATEAINILYVHYGCNEYTSHISNEDLARQYAATHLEHWPLIVSTIEHGGWSMSHYFDSDNPDGITVGTANCGWRYDDERKALMDRLWNMPRHTVGDIRRDPIIRNLGL